MASTVATFMSKFNDLDRNYLGGSATREGRAEFSELKNLYLSHPIERRAILIALRRYSRVAGHWWSHAKVLYNPNGAAARVLARHLERLGA